MQPAPLHAGDLIAITSTARFIAEPDLLPALSFLNEHGFRTVVDPVVYRPNHQMAGTDKERLVALQALLDNPEVKAIWFARGGYGTVRILDQINWSKFTAEPKWLVGYSDLTTLHLKVQQLGFESLHATMPVNVATNSLESLSSMLNCLRGHGATYPFSSHPLQRSGSAVGKLIGGNLSVLYSLMGSPSLPNPAGCILFLEDLDEYLYHMDRMMQNLMRNGWLQNLQAIVAGGFTDFHDNSVPYGKQAEEILVEYASQFNLPLALGFPAGHLARNLALPLGRTVQLEVSDTPVLHFA